MLQTAPFKRGDTFSLKCIWKVSGIPTDISSLTISSQIRTANGALIATLQVVPDDQISNPGAYALVAANPDTSNWPVGNAYCDIQIDDQGIDRSSDTFVIPVVEDITR